MLHLRRLPGLTAQPGFGVAGPALEEGDMPKHDYHWTFGRNCHISFPGGGAPIVEPIDHAFQTDEGCATWSDGSGNLLFYTDGQVLYDSAHNPFPSAPLGGKPSSTHSAIIVPPAGGGTRYHIFAMQDWAGGLSVVGPLTYTPVTAAGGSVAVAAPPATLAFGPQRASERLAAVPHVDCDKYWVVSLHIDASAAASRIFSMRIDSDAGPVAGKTWSWPYPYPPATAGYWMGFSRDGTLLALGSNLGIDILNFDRATGAVSAHSQVAGTGKKKDTVYGVEFSPDGRHLYFTCLHSGEVRSHKIVPGNHSFSSTALIDTIPATGNFRVGALQLGPNGKIYGVKVRQNTLFEIGDPDNAANIQYRRDALQADGNTLRLHDVPVLGLPTFTRISRDCADNCRNLAGTIDRQLAQREPVNQLRPCRGEQEGPRCEPLEIPRIAPQTYIGWGDSRCDCIEGDDTEVMKLTICNPYRNLTLSNLVVHQLVVVDAAGNPVPNLPDGSSSIQLVPVGPYCFDDIVPCTCVTREFVLRLRGAPGGSYRILVRGICFDACFHGDEEDCFIFDVCKD
jgi:hypothetical protein